MQKKINFVYLYIMRVRTPVWGQVGRSVTYSNAVKFGAGDTKAEIRSS